MDRSLAYRRVHFKAHALQCGSVLGILLSRSAGNKMIQEKRAWREKGGVERTERYIYIYIYVYIYIYMYAPEFQATPPSHGIAIPPPPSVWDVDLHPPHSPCGLWHVIHIDPSHPSCGMSGVDIGFKIWNQKQLSLVQDGVKISPLLSSHAWYEQADVCAFCKKRLDMFIVIYNDFDARWYISVLL